jgi:hypothetical protein
MKRILFLFAVAALLAQAQDGSHTVGVFLSFESLPAAAPLRIMEEKVQELLEPSGLSLDFRLASANHGTEPFHDLVVLTFKGACRSDAAAPAHRDFGSLGEARALAATRVSHGHVLPFGEVRCDEIRAALSYLRPDAGNDERQAALGVALGRVVAHELYHVLARTTGHAAQGLARATQSLRDLVSGRELEFRREDVLAIRAGFAAHDEKKGQTAFPRPAP